MTEFIGSNGEWIAFSDATPESGNIVQQYLGDAVIDGHNPPDWAFPTSRYIGEDSHLDSATHWRYVEAPG